MEERACCCGRRRGLVGAGSGKKIQLKKEKGIPPPSRRPKRKGSPPAAGRSGGRKSKGRGEGMPVRPLRQGHVSAFLYRGGMQALDASNFSLQLCKVNGGPQQETQTLGKKGRGLASKHQGSSVS